MTEAQILLTLIDACYAKRSEFMDLISELEPNSPERLWAISQLAELDARLRIAKQRHLMVEIGDS